MGQLTEGQAEKQPKVLLKLNQLEEVANMVSVRLNDLKVRLAEVSMPFPEEPTAPPQTMGEALPVMACRIQAVIDEMAHQARTIEKMTAVLEI